MRCCKMRSCNSELHKLITRVIKSKIILLSAPNFIGTTLAEDAEARTNCRIGAFLPASPGDLQTEGGTLFWQPTASVQGDSEAQTRTWVYRHPAIYVAGGVKSAPRSIRRTMGQRKEKRE